MRALLVEDDPRIADDVVRALTSAGFRVEHLADGQEAWFRGGTEAYDLIVLDLGHALVPPSREIRGKNESQGGQICHLEGCT